MKPRRPKSREAQHRKPSRPAPAPARAAVAPAPAGVLASREVFWQNVVREILSNLSTLCAMRPKAIPAAGAAGAHAGAPDSAPGAAPSPAPASPASPPASPPAAPSAIVAAVTPRGSGPASTDGAPAPEGASDGEDRFPAELFDGRLAVITRLGQRVPIADVTPLFACGIDDPRQRSLSLAVECTVFQIRTPGGEVFTIPLHEVRAVHALTPELMRRLERAARRQERRHEVADEDKIPFGFAAFTSLSRGGPSIVPEAPDHPTE